MKVENCDEECPINPRFGCLETTCKTNYSYGCVSYAEDYAVVYNEAE
jgi:hypothetical protein